MTRSFILYLCLIVALMAACGRQTDAPTVALQPPPTDSAALETLATASPQPPAPNPQPTATLAPPPVLVTPAATPAPPATATPAAEPTTEGVLLLTVADFGPNRNPLTGELVEDPTLLQRRPIAIKISNFPVQYVRPQSGLSQADLVFEHVTEAFITRFTAVFLSQTPEKVGPVRSARLIDLELPAMYDAALAYSGASIGVSQRLSTVDFRDRILRSNQPGYYRTGENKPYEHTLYAQPELFWQVLDDHGLNQAPQFTTMMAFGSATPAGGQPATTIHIQYASTTTVEWRWDAAAGRYWRWVDGEPHLDANNDEQISAANVVAVVAAHPVNRSICENLQNGQCLAFSTEIQIWGRGAAVIFRDGQQFQAIWKRENRTDMLTFTDAEGNPIPLQIGNTWFQMIPGGEPVILSVTG